MSHTVWLASVAREVRDDFARSRCVVLPNVLPIELARRWRAEAERVAQAFSRTIERKQDGHVLSYRVVTGGVIERAWPELWDFYVAPETSRWVAEIAGEPRIYTSPQLQSAININVLEQPGNVYRWHFDAVPYTLILFLTDTDSDSGGVLQVWPNSRTAVETGEKVPCEDKLMRVEVGAGAAVLMDGSVCYHRVTELKRPHLRLTVPMVFPPTNEHSRPNNLDSYLYGAARES